MRRANHSRGFTILEVMIAIGIFAMVITAIYAVWISILKGSQAALRAAASVQRSRIALHTLHDAFLTMQYFTENPARYRFEADTSGDMATISMVARLPASFPGVGIYGDQFMRRITFATVPGEEGDMQLVMSQQPMLMENLKDPPRLESISVSGRDWRMGDRQGDSPAPYTMVLARDVSLFTLEFWDAQRSEWIAEWLYTNRLPQMVAITLGTGTIKGGSTPQDVVTQVVAIPAAAVGGLQRGPPGGQPGGGVGNQPIPNQPNPIPNQPGVNPNPGNRGRSGNNFQRPSRL